MQQGFNEGLPEAPLNVQNLFLNPQNVNIAQDRVDRTAGNITDILAKVEQDVAERCEVDVATPFQSLDIPKQRENPVLRTINFYKGRGESETYESHDYRNRHLEQDKIVTLNQLHWTVNGRLRHVMLVASVGTGKSTLVKRYCKMTIDQKVTLLKDVQCILQLEFQNIEPSEKSTPECLLLSHLAILDENEKHELFMWMKCNPSKVLIAIDGLDQAQFSLDGRGVDVGYSSCTSPKNIILSLFKGKLFKESYLLTSSRDYAAMRIPNDSRPNSVITLQGLQGDAIERLVKAFAGKDDGEHVWEVLSSKSPSFLAMCEAPLFLILATASYKENPENPPSTMSGLMMHVLLNFVHSSHSTEQRSIYILKKLMKLSYHGIKRSRLTFSAGDFANVGLELDKVKDLIIMTPRKTKRIVHQKLLEGDISLYFCHLSFQEALAALYIAYMKFEEFTTFAESELYNTHWAVVKRILYASLLNKETFDVMKEVLDGEEPTDWHKKKKLLKDSIKIEIESAVPTSLPLFMILQECGDAVDDIREQVKDIRIFYKLLTRSDMYNIMSVAQHRPVLDYVGMSFCNLTADNLCIFEKAMKEKPTKIKRMEIPFNRQLCEQSCRMLGEIVALCSIEDFSMQECDLTVDRLRGFKNSLLKMSAKLPILDLCKNKLEHEHINEIIELLPMISKELWVRKADISEADVPLLESAVSKTTGLTLQLD